MQSVKPQTKTVRIAKLLNQRSTDTENDGGFQG